MLQIFKKSADYSVTRMETRDHFKNGASPKSQMSKMNIRYLGSKTLINTLFACIVSLLFSSCTKSFYQIYNVSSIEKSKNPLLFEDDNCKIFYDFWTEGGSAAFVFYNKTTENIFINKELCFFIQNGKALNYYKQREYSYSSSSSVSVSETVSTSTYLSNNYSVNADVGTYDAISASASKSVGYTYGGFRSANSAAVGATSGISGKIGATVGATVGSMFGKAKAKGMTQSLGTAITYQEEKVVCIPPQSYKVIEEYNITNSLYRDCTLYKHPKTKQVLTSKFKASDSPIRFTNVIAYSIGDSKNLYNIENEFYISSITNFPEKEVVEYDYEVICGQSSWKNKLKYFTIANPSSFYIHYSSDDFHDEYKH